MEQDYYEQLPPQNGTCEQISDHSQGSGTFIYTQSNELPAASTPSAAAPAAAAAAATEATAANANERRQVKLNNLCRELRKAASVKDYKSSHPDNILEWLKKLDLDIARIAKGVCNLNVYKEPLSNSEYVDLLSNKLDHTVLMEIEQKFVMYEDYMI